MIQYNGFAGLLNLSSGKPYLNEVKNCGFFVRRGKKNLSKHASAVEHELYIRRITIQERRFRFGTKCYTKGIEYQKKEARWITIALIQ